MEKFPRTRDDDDDYSNEVPINHGKEARLSIVGSPMPAKQSRRHIQTRASKGKAPANPK